MIHTLVKSSRLLGFDLERRFAAIMKAYNRRIMTDKRLAIKACRACEEGDPPLTTAEIAQKQKLISPAWRVVNDQKLEREFKFADFAAAMDFVNQVAEVANSENHHPDIYIFYNRVRLELSTHAVHGLSENDFIMAAKIDLMLERQYETDDQH